MSKKKAFITPYKELKEKVAIVWTRVSSYQQENENCSLTTQREDCEKFAKANNIRIKYYLGGHYESAKNEGKGFMEMIKLARKDKEVNVILVRTTSRFGRCGEETMATKARLRKEGIYVIPTNESFDPDDKTSRLWDNMRALLDNYDNELRKEATYSGTKASLNRGEWCLHAPLGYRRVGKEGTHHVFEITEMGQILRNAWVWRAQGEREVDIVKKLNAMGLRTGLKYRDGKPINSGSPIGVKYLSKILKNPFYAGWISYPLIENEEHRVKGNHPALIDEETFNRANGLSFAGYERSVEPDGFPLNMFIRCAHCNSTLTGYTATRHNKNGKDRVYQYYKCNNKGCKHNYVADKLHKEFVGLLNSYHLQDALVPIFREVVKDVLHSGCQDHAEIIRQLKSQETQADKKLKAIQYRFAAGEIDKDIYESAKEICVAELSAIRKQLEEEEAICSNATKQIDDIIVTACKLGDIWKNGSYKTRHNLELLVFPEGISYDAENGFTRTPRTNEVFVLFLLIINDLRDVNKKRSELDSHQFASWSRRGDSNARPPRPERGALPTALLLDASQFT